MSKAQKSKTNALKSLFSTKPTADETDEKGE
jgi:hypothetical protein